MRLFVDVDDTLILWDDSARQMNQDQSLWMGDKYKVNIELIGVINNFASKNPLVPIYVWSGGGRNYARHWADLYLDNVYDIALAKDTTLPNKEDICIDDQILSVKAILVTWQEFVDKYSPV